MTGIIRNHIQWPVMKNRASAANGVSAMIVSRTLARSPRPPAETSAPAGSGSGPGLGRSTKRASRSAWVTDALALVTRSSCSPGSSRPACQCSPRRAIAPSRSALPTRLAIPLPLSYPAGPRVSSLMHPILPQPPNRQGACLAAVSSTHRYRLAAQAVRDPVDQGDPAGLDDVRRHPDRLPGGGPVRGLDEYPGHGVCSVGGIQDADPEVDQLELVQLGVGARKGLSQSVVQRVDRAVALSGGQDAFTPHGELDRGLGHRLPFACGVGDDPPGLDPEVAEDLAGDLTVQQQLERGAVSYTHLTLPTNREV